MINQNTQHESNRISCARCKKCNKQMLWIRSGTYSKCKNEVKRGREAGKNQNDRDNQTHIIRQQIRLVVQIRQESIYQQNNNIHNQGYISSIKH